MSNSHFNKIAFATGLLIALGTTGSYAEASSHPTKAKEQLITEANEGLELNKRFNLSGFSALIGLRMAKEALEEAGFNPNKETLYKQINMTKAGFEKLQKHHNIVAANKHFKKARTSVGDLALINLTIAERHLENAGFKPNTKSFYKQINTTKAKFKKLKKDNNISEADRSFKGAQEFKRKDVSAGVYISLSISERHLERADFDLNTEKPYKAIQTTKNTFKTMKNTAEKKTFPRRHLTP